MMSKDQLSVEAIEIRVWAFVVGVVTLILAVIVGALLYSVTFVVQPIKTMAPIDMAYTKMLNDIVLLIVGGIGGIMSKRAVRNAAENMANAQPTTPQVVTLPPLPTPAPAMPDFNWMGYKNPDLDETWTPGPPPTTPPDFIPPEAREIAYEREAARGEA